MLRKLGRRGGAGRGGGRRLLPPPPRPLHRPPSAVARPSTTTRSGPATDAAAASPPDTGESFRLVRGEPNFAAIIRLTPDIVEEIRRVEAEGGSARVKFDSNPNHISGNVIDVGGKEFRFTWSGELGDLCDIYEERQSGEDGNGLLIESGSAWRKLNVQRILDESAKNHVKMRSEEAERLQKSRKAIVLDPTNSSVKNQVKSMAAAGIEGSFQRMNWKQKTKLPSQKQKLESNQGLPKPALKSGKPSSIIAKSRMLVSPRMTPSERQGPDIIVSTFGVRNFSNPEEASASLNLNKENIGSFEKEMPVSVVQGATHEATGRNPVIRDEPTDLRSILITLLSKNPNGMVPKAFEKAAGEAIPNSRKKIKSVLKNIATFQAPGRYFLKPGVEIECSKRQVTESESYSFLESARERTSTAELVFVEKDTGGKFKQQSQLSSNLEDNLHSCEKIEVNQNDNDRNTIDRKAINDNDGRPCSSSESESESGSGGSDSGSQSKSRIPAVNRSSSSSDSESDGSPSSEEGSDMEIEIMSGDDAKAEAKHENETIRSKVPSLPKTASADGREVIGVTINDHKGQIMSQPSDFNCFKMGRVMESAIEVSEESPTSNSVKSYQILNNEISKSVEMDRYQMKFCSSVERISSDSSPVNCKQTRDDQVSNDRNIELLNRIRSAKQTMSIGKSVHEQPDVSERSMKLKLKRVSDLEDLQDKNTKRSKSVSSDQGISSMKSRDKTMSENSVYDYPICKEHVVRAVNKVDGNTDNDMQKSLAKHGPSVSKDPPRCGGAHQKIPASVLPQHDNKIGGRIRGCTDRHNNVINHSYERRECFSDGDNSFYSKYDKDKPELRGPVKNFSQFEEYVKEYREKYDHYCALNRNLQNTSNNFVMVGKDLEIAKGRNMEEYYTLVEQLNRMYCECGRAHKKKKKVFILLHDELQNLKQRLSDFALTYKRE